MSFQLVVQQAYDAISSQLTQAIHQEIRQNDKQALVTYDNLISTADNEITMIKSKYDTKKLSPIDKVTWNTLLSLRAKMITRREAVQSRLQSKEMLVINGQTESNASSYSSFMSAFAQKQDKSQFKKPQPLLPSRQQTSTRAPSSSHPRKSLELQRPRNSLDLPPPRGSLEINKKHQQRRERPKSVDLTISQAAVLAWQDQPRRVSSYTRAQSPVRSSSSKKVARKYEYVQPTINTQINLTHVTRSKSPINPIKKKEAVREIVSSNGNVVSKGERERKKYHDPRIQEVMDDLQAIDRAACEQILDEIMVKGEKLQWDDIAGLQSAKQSLKETVVYPFLRPDLFKGLREPITGMLLFGPPGTGKTMIAKTVANESQSTFFSISASSLLSKYLGESEKLIRSLFFMAKKLAPSIIFFDEIDSLLSARSDGEHESSRRVKTEFLIQWSSLSSATAREDENTSRVLVLAATNLPWAIDEAARRRFTRRLYIPLPEFETRMAQFMHLMQNQKNSLSEMDFIIIANKTEGYSNSDITSLAKEAAMEPIREIGENLMSIEHSKIRGLVLSDFERAMKVIRKSVAPETLKSFEDWAARFGSAGA